MVKMAASARLVVGLAPLDSLWLPPPPDDSLSPFWKSREYSRSVLAFIPRACTSGSLGCLPWVKSSKACSFFVIPLPLATTMVSGKYHYAIVAYYHRAIVVLLPWCHNGVPLWSSSMAILPYHLAAAKPLEDYNMASCAIVSWPLMIEPVPFLSISSSQSHTT